jgi:hypothetical protein
MNAHSGIRQLQSISVFAFGKNAEMPSKYVGPYLICQTTISGIAIFGDNQAECYCNVDWRRELERAILSKASCI